ncbi:hypothetical protein N865_09505 [Intrasporangium oryzae NRRL B-24470]|uniref:Glycosyltransferase RgtA/B/C/D-like domain-containing protein n=1 Tax=Intrasporangium oryzae NRRL B-24470 TaxID=1386089 RepID=W9GBV7_9MICO|nr:hypothetical protein N865_09505 [Intrasporangium oryzae NRRL B-24470]
MLRPVRDPDTFWHLRTGDYLRQTWEFVLSDPWSSASEKRWILNQWLPELAMSGLAQVFGLGGAALYLSLATAGIFTALWVACRHRASALVAALVAVVALFTMSASLSPRPQLVTFALTVVTADAWLRTSEDLRPRWWLIPVSWLWACSHGMWFLGPVVGGLVVLGMAFERRVALRRLAPLAAIPLMSFVVAAFTPVGPVLLASPFQVGEITAYITEWQPVSATEPVFIAALLLVAVVLIHAAREAEGRRWHVFLLLLLALALAFTYARTVAIAGAVLAPLAAAALQQLTRQDRSPVTRREVGLSVCFGAGALALAAIIASTGLRSPGLGPNGLNAQLDALPSRTVVCNDWIDGGWLIWRHPQLRVTIDPRAEIYSVKHIRGYQSFAAAVPGWEDYVRDTGCRYALVSQTSATYEALTKQAKWRVAASADGSALLQAPSP